MKTYTYTEARQKLATLLDRARREGRVQIRRRDGQLFVLQPARTEGSPLDVPGVRVRLRRGETRDWLTASREESAERLLDRGLSDKPTKARHKSAPKRKGKTKARGRD